MDWPGARGLVSIWTVSWLTLVQIFLSEDVIVLNSDIPRIWSRLARVVVRTNALAIDANSNGGSGEMPRRIVLVTSWVPFRRAHIVISAFARSGLALRGWELWAVGRETNHRYEAECRRIAAACSSVFIAQNASDARRLLGTAAVAVFPSRIEGSSIAFLEALTLTPRIVALDRPHFRESADADASASVVWVKELSARAWADAIFSTAVLAERELE